MKIRFRSLFLLFVFCLSHYVYGQQADYVQVITKRSEKIVEGLGITDSVKFYQIRSIITDQYKNINNHHEARGKKQKILKEQYKSDKQQLEEKLAKLEKSESKKLNKIHYSYLSKLSKKLTTKQVDQVKDGMTYGVLPLTYKAYQEMLPELKAEQKKQILIYLTEARELAMDAESSKSKHAIFGKYKGKINNYLSGQGVDMKKAGEDWQKRIKNNSN